MVEIIPFPYSIIFSFLEKSPSCSLSVTLLADSHYSKFHCLFSGLFKAKKALNNIFIGRRPERLSCRICDILFPALFYFKPICQGFKNFSCDPSFFISSFYSSSYHFFIIILQTKLHFMLNLIFYRDSFDFLSDSQSSFVIRLTWPVLLSFISGTSTFSDFH